jgi:hypothetical protein
MSVWQLSRRTFLRLAASCGTVASLGCPFVFGKGRFAYKRSGRDTHTSQAAKKHNANHLYASYAAAAADPAHPGDSSKVVHIVISKDRYDRLFRYTDSVDLRQMQYR